MVTSQMVYDPLDGYDVLFGGLPTTTSSLNDTWVFQDGAWTELHPTQSPPPMDHAMMAWDPVDGYVVLFGGDTSTVGLSNATWAFRAGNWTQLHPAQAPSPRVGSAMAWDPAEGAIVLFGGNPNSEDVNDTWSFVGGNWTNLSLMHAPSPRQDPAFAYDPPAGYAVLFGGWNPSLQVYNDTWAFENGSWTNLSRSVAPTPRFATNMQYFAPTGALVLFGGDNGKLAVNNESWWFQDGAWTNHSGPGSPPPLGSFAMTQSASGTGLVLFGGKSVITGLSNWTWELYALNLTVTANATRGDAPAELSLSASVVGGTSPVTVDWSLGDGTFSTALSLNHTYGRSGTYVVTVTATDTLGLSSQLNFSVQVYPPLVVAVTGAPLTGVAPLPVQFEASIAGGAPPYLPVWTLAPGEVRNTSNTSFTYGAAGTQTVTFRLTDAAGGLVVRTLTVQVEAPPVSIPPLQVSFSASSALGEAPFDVTFNASAAGGISPYTEAWTFGDGGTSSGATTSHLYTTPGHYRVSLNVTDANGTQAGAPPVPVVVVPHVALTVVATPDTGAAPLTVNFTSQVTGGLPPYTLLWTYGDGSSQIAANASHTYAGAGPFNVSAEVVDSGGSNARATTTVRVQSAPGPGPGPGPGTNTTAAVPWYASGSVEGALIGAVIGAVAGAAGVAIWSRRRARDPGAGSDHEPTSSE